MGLKHHGKVLHPAGVTRHSSGDSLGIRKTIFREKEECLNQQSIVCAIRQGQLERMAGFPNLKDHVEGES